MNRLITMIFSVLLLAGTPASATEAGWALLRNGGQVVFLVNANAPGSGDPANFDIENCRTQRNLSDRGRQQARRIGALISARAEPVGQVYASRYCRTLQTAHLAFGERLVEEMAALDPPSEDEDAAEGAAQEVTELIRTYSGSGNLVLVTHPETVEVLVGITPREGEAVIVAPTDEGIQIIGRIVFN
jgi:phosphohistidine phosphatase SixA